MKSPKPVISLQQVQASVWNERSVPNGKIAEALTYLNNHSITQVHLVPGARKTTIFFKP